VGSLLQNQKHAEAELLI